MKPNEMTPSQLTRQKNAGFILPMLLTWFSWAWILALTTWISERYHTDWALVLILISWPILSHAMGILSAFCWQHQLWDDNTRRDMTHTFSIYFWFFSFPLTIGLLSVGIGFILIPLQVVCHNYGVARGTRWIRTNGIDKFLGRKNDWERHDSD